MEVGMYNKTGSYDVALQGKIKGKDFEFTKHINFSDTASTNQIRSPFMGKNKNRSYFKFDCYLRRNPGVS